MADNYLEQRMEDLRTGRLGISAPSSQGVKRKGFLQVPFPSRRVLVTGGANGIGLEIVRAYLRAGCKVAVFDIDKDSGEALASKEGVRFYCTDITDADAVENAFRNLLEAWRDVDIVVNNAGIAEFSPLTSSSVESFDRIIATNLRPAYLIARLWGMHRRRYQIPSDFGGRMINISSTRRSQSEKGTEGYSASKGAIAALTHALMMSLSEFGITVNSISPGWIHTGKPEDLSDNDHRQHPSLRVGKPEDIARACLFLSLPGNDFINGTDITIDGGMTHKMIYAP